MNVRVADRDDAAGVTALVRSAYRGPTSRAGWTTEADLLDDERIDEATVAEKITAPLAAVLLLDEDAGGLVGCCEVASRGAGLAYFGMFAIDPQRQSAGLGGRLLRAAEHHAATHWQANTMEMTVISVRVELIAWYARRGYSITGETRPFPYDKMVNGRALRDDLVFSVLRKPLACRPAVPPSARRG